MSRWEYTFYETSWPLQALKRINEKGKHGWECYAVTQLGGLENLTVFWFKKLVKSEQEESDE